MMEKLPEAPIVVNATYIWGIIIQYRYYTFMKSLVACDLDTVNQASGNPIKITAGNNLDHPENKRS